MGGSNKTLIQICIAFIAATSLANDAIQPALELFIQHFAPQGFDVSFIMMVITIPSLCIVIFSPVYAALARRMKRKALLLIAVILYLVGGLVPFFFSENLYFILVCRALLGIGMTFCITMGFALTTDFFGGSVKNATMGIASAGSYIGAICLKLLGGWLGGFGYQYVFLTYLFSAVLFVLPVICLPEPDVARPLLAAKGVEVADFEGEQARQKEKSKFSMPVESWFNIVVYTVFFVAYISVLTNSSTFIIGEGFADVMTASIILSLMTVFMFIGGCTLGKVISLCHKFVLPLGYIITLAGLVVGWMAQDLVMLYVMAALVGLGQGLIQPAIQAVITGTVSPVNAGFAISLALSISGIGGFLQPYIYEFILNAIGQTVGRGSFLISVVVMIIVVVLSLVSFLIWRNRTYEEAAAE